MTGSLNCGVCGIGFSGRSDARYCSPACRQKAHRGRTAKRIAALVESRHPGTRPEPRLAKADIAETLRRARHVQGRSRELCRDAAAARRESLVSQQRWRENLRSAPWAEINRNAEGRP